MKYDNPIFDPMATIGALGSFAVTPSDTVFANGAKIRKITINVAGVVAWKDVQGQAQITDTLPVGTYDLFATAIMATGTTATGITAWY